MEKSREEVLLLSVGYVIKYWEDGIFSDDEAKDRVVFHTSEYLDGIFSDNRARDRRREDD